MLRSSTSKYFVVIISLCTAGFAVYSSNSEANSSKLKPAQPIPAPCHSSTSSQRRTPAPAVVNENGTGIMTAESKPGDADAPRSPPPTLVYHLTKDASVQTRHLVVYNTGPAVGVDEVTLRRVFEAYGEVERVYCPNPAAARVLITFHEVGTRMGCE